MKKPIILIALIPVFLLLLTVWSGCGTTTTAPSSGTVSTKPAGTTTSRQQDEETLKGTLESQAASNPDFSHYSFDRIDFATDNQGNEWALLMTKAYYKSNPSDGLFEAYVFEKVGGIWKEITAGSGGFSEGVPREVQKEWGIEGQ